MPKPLEIYREWEREAPVTMMHVLIIERGDGSAANRLTLTDRPYVDKGVGGTRYHHTYAAPIHCIIEPIETNEENDSTSFDPIVLSNGDGRLDGILDEIIESQPFTILRGDSRWSLLETDYPERFIEFAKGVVDSVTFLDGGTKIELEVSPVRYGTEQTVGVGQDLYGVGYINNSPAVVVDTANLKYRCNTVRTSEEYFKVFDNGVELTLTTDYSLIKETSELVEDVGGEFYGKFQLVSAPSGVVTTKQNTATTTFEPGVWLLSRAIRNFFYPNYPSATSVQDVEADIHVQGIFFKPDGTELYVCGTAGWPVFYRWSKQYTLSTAWDLSTMSHTATLDFAGQMGSSNGTPYPSTIQINADGTELYIISTDGVFFQYTLSSAWDLSTGTYTATFDLDDAGLTASACDAMYIHGNTVFVVETTNVYQLSMTDGDISTLTGAELVLVLEADLGAGATIPSIDFSADGKKLYYTDISEMLMIRQLDLPTAWDLTETVDPRRSYFYEYFDIKMYNVALKGFRMSTDGDQFYVAYNYGSEWAISEFDGIESANLPEDIMGMKNVDTGVGVFYNSQTTKGAVLADISKSLGMEYYISRKGSINLFLEKDPGQLVSIDDELVFPLSLGDMIGERGTHIRHIETLPPLSKVTVSYNRNFNPLSESESAGSLSVAEKKALATESEYDSFSNPEGDYADSPEQSYDTYCANLAAAIDVKYIHGYFRFEPRFYFEITVSLAWSSLVDRFDIGRVIQIDGDVQNTLLSDGDYLLVVGRKINWSQNIQVLTVVK